MNAPAPYMFDVLIAFCATHQDYAWFLALLGWATASALGWRLAAREERWSWLPPVALAGVVQALLELVMLATPVRPEFKVPTHPWGDALLHGSTVAALACVWWSRSNPGRWLRSGVLLCAFGLLVWHVPDRLAANLATAALVAAHAMLGAGRALRRSWWESAAVLGAGAAMLLASHGAMADAVGQARDRVEVSLAGLGGGIAAMLASWFAVSALWRTQLDHPRFARWVHRSTDLRRMLQWSVAWLAVGLLLGSTASWLAQRNYRAGAIERARWMAKLVDRQELAIALSEEFKITKTLDPWRQPSGTSSLFGKSTWHESHGESIRALMGQFLESNPDLRAAAIRTHVDGASVLCLQFQQKPEDNGFLLIEGSPNDAWWRDWRQPAEGFRPWVGTSFDEIAETRVPLLTAEGKMLGWLVLVTGVSDWMAVQVQARVQGYFTVLLGLGVAVLWFVQRWREREREEAEQAREEARRDAVAAQEADRLKTSFLAKVSHELRTPLQLILATGEVGRSEASTPVLRRRFDSLMHQAQLLRRMVNDLIDLAAMEAGRFTVVARPVRVPEVLFEAADSLRARASARHLNLFVASSGQPGVVMADPERLQQIVTNLVGNAVKFTAHGRISVDLSCEASGTDLVRIGIVVRDTGPGIPADLQARLFKPFVRGTTRQREEGTGLGLAIVAGLCAQMNGTVAVTSDGATGSCFTVKLDLPRTSAPVVEPPEKSAAPSLVGRRVLVVDDHPDIRALFVEVFEQQGAACREAGNGAEALAWLEKEKFNAVVCDVSMPELDGLEFARRLRAAESGGSRMRLVAASAHARAEDRAAALAAGFDCHFEKPVQLEQLVRSLVPLDELPALTCPPGLPRPTSPLPKIDPPPELRERLRELFRGQVLAEVCMVESQLRLRDWAALRARAHYLKNSAFAVDDTVLFAAMGRLEDAALTQDVVAIEAAWREGRAALVPWLPSPS